MELHQEILRVSQDGRLQEIILQHPECGMPVLWRIYIFPPNSLKGIGEVLQLSPHALFVESGKIEIKTVVKGLFGYTPA